MRVLLFLLLAGCGTTPSDRYWPCQSWEIEFERADGVVVCLGGDAIAPPYRVFQPGGALICDKNGDCRDEK